VLSVGSDVCYTTQPVEKLLAELREECMGLIAQRFALGGQTSKSERTSIYSEKGRDEVDKRWKVAL
jgi:hypothetical protein